MGYGPHLGDWLLPSARWPETLQPACENITERGYRAGVWLAPFMIGCESAVAKQHPEWLLRDRVENM